jgi:hypothetical protein
VVRSLLFLVVAASCLLQYAGSRALALLSVSRQNRAGLIWVGLSALGVALFPGSLVVTDFFVLSVALFGGMLLSRLVGSVGALLIMLGVAAVVDLISTHAGPTRWIADGIAGHPGGLAALRFLAVCIRLRGMILAVIGAGDLMFFTVCVSVTRRSGWPERAALAVPLLGLLCALGVGLFAGLTPAIPFLAAAVGLYACASSAWKRR